MKILGIDSSGMVASVAVMQDDVLLAEYTVNYKKTHSQTLMPMLDEIKKVIELDMDLLDAIAVAAGPGSFTGLRIGSATAKGLGMALDKPIVEVSTLEALAYQCSEARERLVCPMMDARRDQIYCAAYEFVDEDCTQMLMPLALSIDDFMAKVNAIKRPAIFLGDGVPAFRDIIEKTCRVSFEYAPSHRRYQSAAALCCAALKYLKAGRITEAKDHRPIYLRLSQAERERMEQKCE